MWEYVGPFVNVCTHACMHVCLHASMYILRWSGTSYTVYTHTTTHTHTHTGSKLNIFFYNFEKKYDTHHGPEHRCQGCPERSSASCSGTELLSYTRLSPPYDRTKWYSASWTSQTRDQEPTRTASPWPWDHLRRVFSVDTVILCTWIWLLKWWPPRCVALLHLHVLGKCIRCGERLMASWSTYV